jgi:hypothetical protein
MPLLGTRAVVKQYPSTGILETKLRLFFYFLLKAIIHIAGRTK